MTEGMTLGEYADRNPGPWDVEVLVRLLGSGWRGLPLSEAKDALLDAQARRAAEFAQEAAELDEELRFGRAVQAAMVGRGATYGDEVYDDVARELYGGHTALTRRVIAQVAEIETAAG